MERGKCKIYSARVQKERKKIGKRNTEKLMVCNKTDGSVSREQRKERY